MHDKLLDHQGELLLPDLRRYAEEIGLDAERFWRELLNRSYAEIVDEDVASADASGVAGTPTFFINGKRHQGAYDIDTLTDEVQKARRRVRLREKAGTQPVLD
jgi:predicted DsbA family dithiol-disulfide isomerase